MVFSLIAEAIRVGSLFLLPSRKQILEWELEELRKLREEMERRNYGESRDQDDDFQEHLFRALRELEIAKMRVACPAVQNLIDEILLFAEEKLNKELRWLFKRSGKDLVSVAEEVLTEEGVTDWNSLDEDRKRLIKEKIKVRLSGGG